jgi:hypothetical protein
VDTRRSSARTCIRSFIWLQVLTAFQKEEVKIVYSLMVLGVPRSTVVSCIFLTLFCRK